MRRSSLAVAALALAVSCQTAFAAVSDLSSGYTAPCNLAINAGLGSCDRSAPVEPTVSAPEAVIVQMSVRTIMGTLGHQIVLATVQNNGSRTWTRGAYFLGTPDNSTTWGFHRVDLPVERVAPGELVTFYLAIRAPIAPGVYPFQFQIVEENVRWVGVPSGLLQISVIDAIVCRFIALPSPWCD